jgi:phytanoyl-CoA hydroxylase
MSTLNTKITSSQIGESGLSSEQIARFQRDGYIAFENVLSLEEVEKCKIALSRLVREVAQGDSEKRGAFWTMPQRGAQGQSGKVFGVQFENGYLPDGNDPDLELKVRKLMWYVRQDKTLEYVAFEHPGIQRVLESLLGAQPIMFQDMALVKPPFIGSEKPWHQDNAYFSVTPLDAIVGVWIALDEATPENGCMHVQPGGHRRGALQHHHDRDCEIVPGRLENIEAVPVPLQPGGAMFFYGMLPHQTPPNNSPERRRALQFHYRSQNSQIVSKEEYDAVYNDSGVPASCAAN